MRHALPLLLVVILAGAGLASAAPGEFDRSFADRGIFTLPDVGRPPSFDTALHVTTDSLDRVLGSGRVYTTDVFTRNLDNGSPDGELEGRGYRLGADETFTPTSNVMSVALASGRSLVMRNVRPFCTGPAAPLCASSPGTYQIRRFDSSGQLDTSYGTAGVATPSPQGFYAGHAVEPAGGLVLLGMFNFPLRSLTLVRLDGDGRADDAFLANTRVTAPCSGRVPDQLLSARLLRQSDGKLLIAQTYRDAALAQAPTSWTLCVRRLNTDGTLDTTYAFAGEANFADPLFPSSTSNMVVAILPAPGGGAVVLVQKDSALSGSQRYSYVNVWLRPGGSLDASRADLGIDGPKALHVSFVTAAAIDSLGRLYLAGYPEMPRGQSSADGYDRSQPRVGRLRLQGGNDVSFGVDGQGFTPLVSNGKRVIPSALHLGRDNFVYVAGALGEAGPVNGNEIAKYAIARLQGDTQGSSGGDGGGGGGGCGSISTPMPPDPTLPALVLLSLTLLLSRRRHVGR